MDKDNLVYKRLEENIEVKEEDNIKNAVSMREDSYANLKGTANKIEELNSMFKENPDYTINEYGEIIR